MVDVPLLNSYKQAFIRKRLWQTLFGGLYINYSSPTPCCVHILEIIVWFFPWLVGGIFTVVREVGQVETLHSAIGVGLIVGCGVFLLQLLSFLSYRGYERSLGDSTQNLPAPAQSHQFSSSKELRRLLSEEDAITFDSFNWFQTLFFIFVPKKYWFNVGVHSIISGAVCALVYTFLLPSNLNKIFQSTATTYVLYVLLWIVTCISQFPLITGKHVPETATYRSVDIYEIANLSRPFHIFIILIPYIAWLVHPSSSVLLLITQIFSWLYLAFPFLWFFGVLPPMDCAITWTVEQALIFGFGGSNCSSDLRLLLSAILSVGLYIGSSFISQLLPLLVLNAILGYIISTNALHIIEQGIQYLYSSFTKTASVVRLDNTSTVLKPKKTNRLYHFIWQLMILVSITLLVVLLANFRSQINASNETRNALEYTFIASFCVVKVLQELQLVNIIIGIVTNLLFPNSNYNLRKFKKSKKNISALSGINSVFCGVALPLLFVAYLTLFTNTTALPSWVHALGVLHGYRHIWQRPGNALLNFTVMAAVNLGFRSQGFTNWWTLQQPGVHLLILDICRDRFFRMLHNIWFVLALTIKAQTDEKQRRTHRYLLLVWNIWSSPLTLAICACCAAITSPVLPLFTLPIFFISFPRPSRFWPMQPGTARASICGDTVYYSQLTPAAVDILQSQLSSGALHNHMAFSYAPQYYLARSQDKTLWIQVLESGCGYSYISVKGLELQETSCHALEATKLDDLFSSTFEEDKGSFLNFSNFWSSVTPRDTHFITSYSDAKNSLAGILDQHDSVSRVRLYFMKSLAWLMINKTGKELFVNKQNEDIPGQITTDIPLNDIQSTSVINESVSQRAASALSNQLSLRSPSLDSFMSILSTDNEDTKKPKNKRKMTIQTVDGNSFHNKQDDWDDTNSIFADSGFGLPAQDLNAKKKGLGKFGSDIATVFLPTDWFSSLPLNESDLATDVKLPIDWVNYCFEKLLSSENNFTKAKEVHLLSSICDAIFNKEGIPGKQTSSLTHQHLAKIFSNEVPWSPSYEWLSSKQSLHKYALKAFRYAVKLVYDEVSLGEIESNFELHEYLEEYENDWFIGNENDAMWQSSISQNKPHLFSMNSDKKGSLHARVLSKQEVPLHIASVNAAAVHGIWSDLAFELIYATNDDEERYSIQAHQSLIRNLTIQAADPPLGYPIYSSKATALHTYLF